MHDSVWSHYLQLRGRNDRDRQQYDQGGIVSRHVNPATKSWRSGEPTACCAPECAEHAIMTLFRNMQSRRLSCWASGAYRKVAVTVWRERKRMTAAPPPLWLVLWLCRNLAVLGLHPPCFFSSRAVCWYSFL